jgi:hypothetical protein
MAEETGDIINSASSTNDGTRVNTPIRTLGQFGFGREFTGSGANDYFNVGNLGIANGTNENITLSVWLKANDPGIENWGKVISKRNQSDDGYVYALIFGDEVSSKNIYGVIKHKNTWPWQEVQNNTWEYFICTYNGSYRKLYKNDTEKTSNSQTGALWSSTQDVTIGAIMEGTPQ